MTLSAADYTYMTESFEEAAFGAKNATVTAATGTWTTNKNIHTTAEAASGAQSLLFSNKAGVVLPPLTQGAGTLIYYAKDQNRQATVEVTRDNVTWTPVESYKETSDWTRHVVAIDDPSATGVRIVTNSNNQFYIDDLLLTRPDGSDGEGNYHTTPLTLPYFTNDFEHTKFPQTKEAAATERSYDVAGEGEWKYLNAYKSTKATYITDGSKNALRLLKNGSHVVTPVLDAGVTKIMFDEGRTKRTLTIYTSTDGGDTWELHSTVTTVGHNECVLFAPEVNRIKIANESGSDADLDNLAVCAYPKGETPEVTTGQVTEISSTGAVVSGKASPRGGLDVIECGALWAVGREPLYTDNVVKAEAAGENFSTRLSGLPAMSEIHARAYAVSRGGIALGEEVVFVTASATQAGVATLSLTPDDFTDERHIFIVAKGKVTDTGGSAITETGFVYSTSVSPTATSPKVKAPLYGDTFATSLPLEPETTYYVRAYAVNAAGTALGDELTVTTGRLEVPEYAHNTYYCAPDGDDATADGSREHPFFSLQRAADIVEAGDTIFMLAGTYAYDVRINISRSGAANSGMIALHAKGGRAVLDFAAQPFGDNSQGIRHTASYWHYNGIDITNAGDNGLLIERNKPSGGNYADIAARTDEAHDNLIENCAFYRNADTGLQMKNLAAYNRVVNCDSYFNTDPDHGDADGFAVKISHGTGNYFYGCRAWRNSDDGWDQYIKSEGGFPDDITTTLERCWAFENGILEDGTQSRGNGNGIKMGSNQGRNNVILNRCMVFDNVSKGFDQNHNTGHMILNNCAAHTRRTADNANAYTYRIYEPVAAGHEIRLTNCVNISDGQSGSKSAYARWQVEGATFVTCDMLTLPSDYVTVETEQAFAQRKPDGSLPDIDFLRPLPGSVKFADKGTPVAPFEGESRYAEGIIYEGAAPDLGYYESDASTALRPLLSSKPSAGIRATVTASGDIIVSLEDAEADSAHWIQAVDLGGRTLVSRHFDGHTVSIRPAAAEGSIVVITIDGTRSVKVCYMR